MTVSFGIVATLTLVSAVAAVSLRNLVHCALCLTVTFVGIAAFYLQLDAQFVGFAQILVYVGAVAILIVFALLLTRNIASPERSVFVPSWGWGLSVVVLVFGLFAYCILSRSGLSQPAPGPAIVTVKQVGQRLMTDYVIALEVLALLLTAALIGAVVIALAEGEATKRTEDTPGSPAPKQDDRAVSPSARTINE